MKKIDIRAVRDSLKGSRGLVPALEVVRAGLLNGITFANNAKVIPFS